VHDYSSTRFEYRPTLYAPISYGPLNLTPEIGGVGIFYGNSPTKEGQLLMQGKLGLQAQTSFFRKFGSFKHVIEPSLGFHYFSMPSSCPCEHYIFDINDGWTDLNVCRLGIKNAIYKKTVQGIERPFIADLYSFAFIHSPTQILVPKVYGRFVLCPFPTLQYSLQTAWDCMHSRIDHFNFRTEWTVDEDFAMAFEYRHRSPYSWRKVDPFNFFLENYRSVDCLLKSPLSDRRDTFLFHFFYRFHPLWACEFKSRQGWNRRHEPGYREYEINFLTTIQTALHFKLSFQHWENDNRVALYFNIGLPKPNKAKL
jgi:hypothetical protein